jgi:hypothetical protein
MSNNIDLKIINRVLAPMGLVLGLVGLILLILGVLYGNDVPAANAFIFPVVVCLGTSTLCGWYCYKHFGWFRKNK